MRLSGLGKKTIAEFMRRHGNARGKRLFYQRVESGQLKSMFIGEDIKPVEKKIEQPVVEEAKTEDSILDKVKKVLKV
jgi:hypothetical protein